MTKDKVNLVQTIIHHPIRFTVLPLQLKAIILSRRCKIHKLFFQLKEKLLLIIHHFKKNINLKSD